MSSPWRASTVARLAVLTLVCLLALQASTSIGASTAGLGKIAYVKDGDVWSKELPSGTPVQLTHDQHSIEPQWSHAGAWLSLLKVSEDEFAGVWVMRSDGSDARRIGDGTQISPHLVGSVWSPTDDRLAFVDDDGDIVAEDADGGNRIVLVVHDRNNSREDLGGLLWRPDGKALAYVRSERPIEEALWLIDAAGGTPALLYQRGPSEGALVPATWSGDGSQLYFWRSPIYSASIMADGVDLWSVPAMGGEAKDSGIVTLVYGDYVRPEPGGGILVVAGGNRDSLEMKRLASVDNGTAATLTPPQSAAISPVLSPEGRSIALVGAPNVADYAEGLIAPMADRRIWLIDAEGGNARRLTTDEDAGEERPLWSRDGGSILYLRPTFSFDRQQWRVDATLSLFDLKGGSSQVVLDDMNLDINQASGGFYYSHVDWGYLFDWWQAP